MAEKRARYCRDSEPVMLAIRRSGVGLWSWTSIAGLVILLSIPASSVAEDGISLGPRPEFLVHQLPDGELAEKLTSCLDKPVSRQRFSIGHRGAPLQFPEHTLESYLAAARMGAGILECDVTFTKDRVLVCRHSQCDLHTSTDILNTPLAEKCSSPPDYESTTPFKDVKCCTSDLTLAEFKLLRGRMDSGNKGAKTLEEYFASTARYRTDLYATSGTLMTHRESIALFKSLGVAMTPELKRPAVAMPFDSDYTKEQYAAALIEEYKLEAIEPTDVYPQSFSLQDVSYWLENFPAFARQAVWLDGRFSDQRHKTGTVDQWQVDMDKLARSGVRYLAPPLWMLLTTEHQKIVPSTYAIAAKAAGLNLITWTLERSGPLTSGGGWYYQSIAPLIRNDGDMLTVLDVLAREVGVEAVFSDWTATTTFYANCLEP